MSKSYILQFCFYQMSQICDNSQHRQGLMKVSSSHKGMAWRSRHVWLYRRASMGDRAVCSQASKKKKATKPGNEGMANHVERELTFE